MSRLVLVLGMHRSGTSAVCAALQSLGVEFGERAHWSGFDNPDFFEDREIVAFDDALLHGGGGAWDRLYVAPAKNLPSVEGATHRATVMLDNRLARSPVFGLKEPRMCRLLPVWRPVIEAAGCAVSVVYTVRNPLSVADSLLKRNGIGIEKALTLWLAHVVPAFCEANPSWPKIVIDYDRLVDDPACESERLAQFLGGVSVEAPRRDPAELRHHVHSVSDLTNCSVAPPAVHTICRLLLRMARDEIPPSDPEAARLFGATQREIERQAPALIAMDKAFERAKSMHGAVAGARAPFQWRGPHDRG